MKLEKLKPQDLKCNIFSVYDYEGLTLQELLCQFFTKINECIEICETVVEFIDWLESVGLSQEVARILAQWLEDGTLAKIINEQIFSELNSKIKELENKLNETIEQVEENTNDILELKKEETQQEKFFDICNSQPVYITQCETFKTTVVQGIGYDVKKQNIYMSQVYVNNDWGNEVEHFILNRCDKHGKLLDSMKCKHGGHGTDFGLEFVGDDVWVWTAWHGYGLCGDINKHILVRIKYKPGDIDLCDEGVEYQIINKFTNDYCIATLSSCGKYIALSSPYDSNNTSYKVTIRTIEDLKNNVDNIIHQFDIDTSETLQGLAFDENVFYYRTGTSNEKVPTFSDKINVIDLKTYDIINTLDINCGEIVNDFIEPQGMCLVESLNKKSKSLLLATAKDMQLRRMNLVYMLGHGDIGIQILGSQNDKNKLYKDNGRSFQPPTNITKMSQISRPGWYYFNADRINQMEDRPEVGVGGWLNVSPTNDNGEIFIQEFTSNQTTELNFYRVSRTIDKSELNNVTPWGGSAMELTLWEYEGNKPPLDTVINLKQNYKYFDYLLLKYKFPGGDNSTDQLVSLKYLTGREISQQKFNLDNTTHEPTFYEHIIELSEDGNSFKVKGVYKNTEGSTDFTIKRIVGVRL